MNYNHYNDYANILNGKELIVRKKISSFIEKWFDINGYMFNHDDYKKVIYGEKEITNNLEQMFKDYYDAYYYLLSNHKNNLTVSVFSKFLFILNIDYNMQDIQSIINCYFELLQTPPIEQAVVLTKQVYTLLQLDDNIKTVISLMVLNYMLVKYNIPTITFNNSSYNEYLKVRDDNIEFISLIIKLIMNNKTQDKSYYLNLKPLEFKDIYNQFIKDKELLMNKYGIKKLYVFGSFSKDIARIDSDIDLLISFSDDLTFIEKSENITYLSKHYFDIFNRYIDISELSYNVSSDLMRRTRKLKQVF